MLSKLLNPVLAVVFGLGVISVTACGTPDKPEDVATKFTQAFLSGDIDTAVTFTNLPPEALKDEAQLNQAKGKVQQMTAAAKEKADQQGGVASVTAKEVVETDITTEADGTQRVKVQVELKTGDGTTVSDPVPLIKVPGSEEWKVSFF